MLFICHSATVCKSSFPLKFTKQYSCYNIFPNMTAWITVIKNAEPLERSSIQPGLPHRTLIVIISLIILKADHLQQDLFPAITQLYNYSKGVCLIICLALLYRTWNSPVSAWDVLTIKYIFIAYCWKWQYLWSQRIGKTLCPYK